MKEKLDMKTSLAPEGQVAVIYPVIIKLSQRYAYLPLSGLLSSLSFITARRELESEHYTF